MLMSLIVHWHTTQQRRLVNLLAYEFRKFELPLALSLIDPDRDLTSMNRTPTPKQMAAALTPQDLNVFLSPHDLNRLELYARNMVDHHMVLDLMPTVARLLFCGRLPTLRFAFLQVVIMLGVGLQHRSVESLSEELQLPANQVLAFFNKVPPVVLVCLVVKQIVSSHTSICVVLSACAS
jgi:N-acetyltransferase 10